MAEKVGVIPEMPLPEASFKCTEIVEVLLTTIGLIPMMELSVEDKLPAEIVKLLLFTCMLVVPPMLVVSCLMKVSCLIPTKSIFKLEKLAIPFSEVTTLVPVSDPVPMLRFAEI